MVFSVANEYEWLDYYVDVDGHAVDAEVGAVTLVEGNYFVSRHLIVRFPILRRRSKINTTIFQNTVTTPSLNDVPDGSEYFIQSSTDASTCGSSLGRTCQTNTLYSSGAVTAVVDSSVLSAFSSRTYLMLLPTPRSVLRQSARRSIHTLWLSSQNLPSPVTHPSPRRLLRPTSRPTPVSVSSTKNHLSITTAIFLLLFAFFVDSTSDPSSSSVLPSHARRPCSLSVALEQHSFLVLFHIPSFATSVQYFGSLGYVLVSTVTDI